ncbi:sulfotransferase [Chloroflexi bacterium TSY]|nr:sulfotransferase [Chloroflexi bacterium TSY]
MAVGSSTEPGSSASLMGAYHIGMMNEDLNHHIKGRIFLVGCPRSGTTLLQSLIATQPQVLSFPETHYFGLPGIKRRHFWCLRLGIVPSAMRKRMQKRLQQLALEMNRPDLQEPRPPHSLWLKGHVQAFVTVLDTLTRAEEKSIWLEKTPGHIYFIDLIERYISDARFIHLVQRGINDYADRALPL